MRKPSAKFEYKTFSLGEKLTEEQKEYFKKYGVIHFKKFIDSKTAEIFISELTKIEKTWLEEGIEKVKGTPLKFGKDHEGNPMIQRMCFTNQYSPVLAELLKDPRLQLMIELLLLRLVAKH